MAEGSSSKAETWVQEDDVIYNVMPISYAYPVDNTNQVRPSTSKRKRRTTKGSSEREKLRSKGTRVDKVSPSTSKRKRGSVEPPLSDVWEVKETPRPDGTRVDKTYYHKERHFTLRSLIAVKKYEEDGTLPERKSKTKGKENINAEKEPQEILGKEKEEAENMQINVEDFLEEAHYNLTSPSRCLN